MKINLIELLNISSKLMIILGGLLCYGVVSTSDYEVVTGHLIHSFDWYVHYVILGICMVLIGLIVNSKTSSIRK